MFSICTLYIVVCLRSETVINAWTKDLLVDGVVVELERALVTESIRSTVSRLVDELLREERADPDEEFGGLDLRARGPPTMPRPTDNRGRRGTFLGCDSAVFGQEWIPGVKHAAQT